MIVRTSSTWFRSFCAGLLTVILIACGGGGGGGDDGPTPPPASTPLATGTFTKTFGPNADDIIATPFHGDFDQKVQILYTASEINGTGYIHALRFRRGEVTAAESCPNTTIRLGHTSVSVLTNTFADNVEQGRGSLLTVLDDATVTIPAGDADSWFEIPLAVDFYHNGEDNLVVEVERSTACSTSIRTTRYTAATNRMIHSSFADNVPGTAEHDPLVGNLSSPDVYQNWIQFVFAGGDNTVLRSQDDFFVVVSSETAPFTDHPTDGRKAQMLYTASEINGAGPITGIGFQLDQGLIFDVDYEITVKMGHTVLDSLTNTFANNFSTTPQTIAQNTVFEMPRDYYPADGFFWISFPGSFNYNGTDNLVVEIETNNVPDHFGEIQMRLHTTLLDDRLGKLIGQLGAETGTRLTASFVPAKLRFNGGDMLVMPDAPGPYPRPFAGDIGNTVQMRYAATQLGSAADITGLSLQLAEDSTAEEYTGFSVVMSYTSVSNMSATLADNLDNPATLFTGTIDIPAGMRRGDWVDIPLSTFSYDATKSLLIQITQNAGTSGITNNIFVGDNPGSGIGTATLGNPTFDLEFDPFANAAIRLKYSKD